MLNEAVKNAIQNSVLCWLATCDQEQIPNVSPKEMFTWQDANTLLIANIASPVSMENIRFNKNICVSFVDVFVQKGYKLKGIGQIIEKTNPCFSEKAKILTDLFTAAFPILSILQMQVTKVESIQAPSYFLYPDLTEAMQISNAMKTYKVKPA